MDHPSPQEQRFTRPFLAQKPSKLRKICTINTVPGPARPRYNVGMFNRALSEIPGALVRPKTIDRRLMRQARWTESESGWETTINGWSVRVASQKPGSWEWRAFARDPQGRSRALGGRGLRELVQAQEDAEAALDGAA